MTTVINGQNILDISVEKTGTIENILLIGMDNGMSITDDLEAGDDLTISSFLPIKKSVADYYSKNNIIPGTSNKSNQPVGLGYEYLEYPEPILTCE